MKGAGRGEYSNLVWGLVFGVGFAAIIYQSSFGFQPLFCGAQEDGTCFREWVSALSGWAAVAAAVVTLGSLRQQIETANEHQRENVELTIAARLAAAKAYLFQINAINSKIETIERLCPSSIGWPPVPSNDPALLAINALLKALHDLLTDFRIKRFEDEIGTKWPALLVTNNIAELFHELDLAPHIFPPVQNLPVETMAKYEARIRLSIDLAKNYSQIGRGEADKFVDRWETRLDKG